MRNKNIKYPWLHGAAAKQQFITLLLIGLMLVSGSAFAAEVTIYAGYRGGGDFNDEITGETISLDEGGSAGIILNVPYSHVTEMEFMYSTQPTKLVAEGAAVNDMDIKVDYIQLGGTYLFPRENVTPYFVATLGVVHFNPEGLDSENRFSFSLGAGAKIPFAKRVALRLEGRAFMTSLSSGGALFCNNSQCSITASTSLFAQLEASAGLTVKF
ncbi:MAG: porin family protein [Gammaproteobacteria bacterium]|nr:porin family protein [Gammaproteobacteria bacterium]